MTDLLNGFNINDMLGETSNFLESLAPVSSLILGLLLGFLIITTIVELIRGDNLSDDNNNDIID